MITSLVLVAGFGLFLLLGAPIAYALSFASLGAIWSLGDIPLMIIPQRLAESINSFPIMAVPLFVIIPRLQVTMPAAWVQVPWPLWAATNARPAGKESATTTPEAEVGPRFVTEIV